MPASSPRTSRSLGAALLIVAALAAGCPGEGPGDVPENGAPPPPAGPWAAIEWPADGSAHNTVRLDVRGRARELETLFVNSDRVEVAEDGTWVVDLELPEGEAEIRLLSVDPAASPGEPVLRDSARVTVDLRAPTLQLTGLPGRPHPTRPHVQVVGAEAELVGTLDDAWPGTIAELTLDGAPQTIEDGTFRARLALARDGDHLAELLVRDAAGNKTRLRVPLVRDTAAPVVRIDKNSAQPGRAERLIRGVVVDANPLALYADGKAVTLAAEGEFELQLALADGEALRLVAEDAAGNRSAEVVVELH